MGEKRQPKKTGIRNKQDQTEEPQGFYKPRGDRSKVIADSLLRQVKQNRPHIYHHGGPSEKVGKRAVGKRPEREVRKEEVRWSR